MKARRIRRKIARRVAVGIALRRALARSEGKPKRHNRKSRLPVHPRGC